MFFLLRRLEGGIDGLAGLVNFGVITADTLEEAAGKTGMKVEKTNTDQTAYLGNAYFLHQINEISSSSDIKKIEQTHGKESRIAFGFEDRANT